jgi:hypothetical protein
MSLIKAKYKAILKPVSLFFILLGVLIACSSESKTSDGSTDKTAPTTPVNFSSVVGDTRVTLNWAANTENDLKAYNLYWGTKNDDLSNVVAVDKAATSKMLTGLSNGTVYYFALDAEDGSGNKSAKTQIISAQPQVPDTTAPAIVSRSPGANAKNIEARTSITVVFSEAIKPSTITNESVKLVDSSTTNISKTLSLSEDGRTLTVTPTEKLITPNTFSVTLTNAVTDVAGNALANESWSFETPQWLDFESTPVSPGNKSAYALALDGSGNPFLAYVKDGVLYVKHWDGESWIQLGSRLSPATTLVMGEVSLKVDSSDNPVVAWTEGGYLRIKRWDGQDWTTIVSDSFAGIAYPAAFPFAMDSSGNPVVAFTLGSSVSSSIDVRRWNGTLWEQIGNQLNDCDYPYDPFVKLDNSNKPVVAYTCSVPGSGSGAGHGNVYVKHWDGNSWVAYGGILDTETLEDARDPSLSLDSLGHPIVAWVEGSNSIHVKQWDGNSWSQLDDSSNKINEGSIYVDRTNNFVVNLDSKNKPVIVWREWNSTQNRYDIFIKRRNNANWVEYGTEGALNENAVAVEPSPPFLVFDSFDNPVVAWSENDDFEGTASVFIKKLNQ